MGCGVFCVPQSKAKVNVNSAVKRGIYYEANQRRSIVNGFPHKGWERDVGLEKSMYQLC